MPETRRTGHKNQLRKAFCELYAFAVTDHYSLEIIEPDLKRRALVIEINAIEVKHRVL